jgi:hypothetical protein
MAVGLYSAQVLTLPVSAGTNATNLTGTINGLYPATGPIATQQGGATSDPVSFSALLTAAAFTTSFDIVPGANPFQIVALGISGAGTVQAVVSINPAQRSWQATYTVPTLAARALDLSKAGFTVLDFLTSLPFPANIIPAGRVDPIAQSALDLMPIPTSSPTTGANATYTTSGTIPAGAQFAMPQQQSFGGFFNLLSSQQGPSTATYQLYVDNVLVASTTAQFTIQ